MTRDQRLLEEVLAAAPGSGRDWASTKVCQVCGVLARVASFEEWVAAHAEGGEFVGLGDDHEHCRALAPGTVATRSHRYCEVCRARVAADPERRVWLWWLCVDCERTIRSGGHDIASVLEQLGRVREPERAAEASHVEEASGSAGRRAGPPAGWLPPGLHRCGTCGEVRGETWVAQVGGGIGRARSTCLCEALRCERCGEIRSRRPISDYYDVRDGRFWHVPYFAARQPCARC